jgi:hypothetical protein
MGGKTMDNLLTVALEAHSAELNHDRRYQITLGRDLLDDWTVSICYGRAGQGGQMKRFASPQAEDVRAIIRDRLRRRLTAPKRIGCPYRLTLKQAIYRTCVLSWPLLSRRRTKNTGDINPL